jgi:hypothetical protein
LKGIQERHDLSFDVEISLKMKKISDKTRHAIPCEELFEFLVIPCL